MCGVSVTTCDMCLRGAVGFNPKSCSLSCCCGACVFGNASRLRTPCVPCQLIVPSMDCSTASPSVGQTSSLVYVCVSLLWHSCHTLSHTTQVVTPCLPALPSVGQSSSFVFDLWSMCVHTLLSHTIVTRRQHRTQWLSACEPEAKMQHMLLGFSTAHRPKPRPATLCGGGGA